MTAPDDGLFDAAEVGAPQPELGKPFAATYAGTCAEGDWIAEGDMIRADGAGSWVHADGLCDGEDLA